MSEQPQTWHYGLMAEWWAHFNVGGPEIEYFRRYVERGQPALDAGCGAGRLLLPPRLPRDQPPPSRARQGPWQGRRLAQPPHRLPPRPPETR